MTNTDKEGRAKYDYGYITILVRNDEARNYLQWCQSEGAMRLSAFVEKLVLADAKKNKDYKAAK